MKTYYDVLGVSRKASNETIKTAFRRAVKTCHPDLNADDPAAGRQLRKVLAAYEMLKKPEQRATYDRYLRDCRRASVRSFAMTTVTGLMSGSIVVALAIWLSNTQVASAPPPTPRIAAAIPAAKVSPPASPQGAQVAQAQGAQGAVADSNRRSVDGSRKSDRAVPAPERRSPDDGPRHVQHSANALHPAAARERRQAQASDDPTAIWAFADRNPDASESELARSKLIELIDTAEDLTLLQVLGLGTGAMAERAQQRLVRLGALAGAKEDRTAAPSSNTLKERAASFVSARVAGWSSANAVNLASLASAYADEVLYYGRRKSRQAVALEKRRLLERWPERVYAVRPGSIAVRCLANVCKVGGMMDWQTRNAPRAASASGVARFEYEVAFSRGAFRILSESSSDVKPHRQAASCTKPGSATGETSASAREFHQQAARCLQIAQKTPSAKLKGALLAQGQAWKQRAQEQERIERGTAERLAREAALRQARETLH